MLRAQVTPTSAPAGTTPTASLRGEFDGAAAAVGGLHAAASQVPPGGKSLRAATKALIARPPAA